MAEIRGDAGGDDMVSSESFRVRSPGMGSMAELLRDRRSRELAFSRLGGPFPLLEVEGASASSEIDITDSNHSFSRPICRLRPPNTKRVSMRPCSLVIRWKILVSRCV
jgi:hypothetical protein